MTRPQEELNMPLSTVQEWVSGLPLMQQAVLLSSIRGPDGIPKFHACKDLIKWYRRCILLSAFDKAILTSPASLGGGSFTGPSVSGPDLSPWEERMKPCVDSFMNSRDELPYHFTTHFMHAVEILGYKHPSHRIRAWWNGVYLRMVNALHLSTETEEQMDIRLGDQEDSWRSASDETATCSD